MRFNSVLSSSILGLASLLSVAMPPPAMAADKVVVENSVANPVHVKDVNEPAATAFHAMVQLTLDPSSRLGQGAIAIPPGKRLVIQYSSAKASAPNGAGVATFDQAVVFSLFCPLPGDGTEVPIHFLPASQQTVLGGSTIFVAGAAMQVYCDSPQVTVNVERFTNNLGGLVLATVSISGYLVDAPR